MGPDALSVEVPASCRRLGSSRHGMTTIERRPIANDFSGPTDYRDFDEQDAGASVASAICVGQR
jgi:hypothetical protein